MHFRKTIAKEEIAALPLKAFEGRITVIENARDSSKIIDYLLRQPILGFDTETKPAFRKGRKNKVALLQLSTSNEAFLFRLNHMGVPDDLIKVLADENITKAGVAIRDDIKALRRRHNFEPKGFVELQNYVQEFGIENFGLKKLTAIVLNFRISKSKQLSNWENPKLSEGQLRYAATDAWVSYEIYKKLLENKLLAQETG